MTCGVGTRDYRKIDRNYGKKKCTDVGVGCDVILLQYWEENIYCWIAGCDEILFQHWENIAGVIEGYNIFAKVLQKCCSFISNHITKTQTTLQFISMSE